MKTASAKKNLGQLLEEELLSGPPPRTDEGLLKLVFEVNAASPRRGLLVFDGSANTKPAQDLPPLRPRRALNF